MNEKRLRAREEKEIDLIDLLIEIMLHWRGLIVAFLIGGILLGGYSYYKSYKAHNSAVAAADSAKSDAAKSEGMSDEEKLAQLKQQEEQLEKNAKATSLGNVESAILYTDQIAQLKDYLDSSILMKADLNNLPTGYITIQIIADGGRDNLRQAYESIVTSAELIEQIKTNLGYGSEAGELIQIDESNVKITSSRSVSSTVVNDTDDTSIKVSCYAASVEDCRKLTDIVSEFVLSKSRELQTKLGYHEVVIVDSSVTTMANSYLSQIKLDKQSQLITAETAVGKLIDAFTADEKNLFDLKEKIYKLNRQIEISKAAEISIPAVGISKKKILIGVVLGVFLYAGIICVAYIFSQKIKDSDEFTVTFGTAQLGKLYGKREFKGFGKAIDKWLYSFKNRGRKAVEADEAESIIAANTALSAAKANIKKLGIICADGVEEDGGLLKKLKEAAKKENIEATVLSKLLSSKEEAYSTKDLDAVVLVAVAGKSRYSEVWDAMEVVDNQKIDILGGIMA